MTTPVTLIIQLKNLLSFYVYPIYYSDISPLAAALAAGCLVLGAAAQGVLLYRRKKAAWFPVLCAFVTAVPFLLIYLLETLDTLIDRREIYIPLIHDNPLTHSDLGLYVLIFSVMAAYVLLGALLGWLFYRGLRGVRAGRESPVSSGRRFFQK